MRCSFNSRPLPVHLSMCISLCLGLGSEKGWVYLTGMIQETPGVVVQGGGGGIEPKTLSQDSLMTTLLFPFNLHKRVLSSTQHVLFRGPSWITQRTYCGISMKLR